MMCAPITADGQPIELACDVHGSAAARRPPRYVRHRRWRSASRVAFVARFLGRRLAYSYEIRELVPACGW